MILSIDVEEYFMVSAFARVVKPEDWERYESRVERSTHRILDLLDESAQAKPRVNVDATSPASAHAQRFSSSFTPGGEDIVGSVSDAVQRRPASQNRACSETMPQRATFFCVSWVAQRFPGLIREIRSRGHEVASHGHSHRMITSMTPEGFRRDVRRSKQILEDITGEPILGYRAPSYSITRETRWALQILMEENFLYDASIAPVHHDLYGIPDAPTSPFLLSHGDILPPGAPHARNHGGRIPGKPAHEGHAPRLLASNGHLVEFPMPTLRFLNTNLPFAGGGYFRLLPYAFTRWALKRHSRNGNGPGSFYLHPWELDPQQPRISGASAKSRFRHYLNLNRTETRFRRLLQDFDFVPFRSYLESRD